MFPIAMIANFSGNVGKTTLVKNLLVPRIPNAAVFAVEDVNAGYNQGEATKLSAEETQAILEKALTDAQVRPVIIDVGASNVSNFFAALVLYEAIADFISVVIVPTEPSEKVQTDTLSTIQYLMETLQFPAEKIHLVLNKVPTRRDSNTVFGELVDSAAKLGVLSFGEIPESNTFQIAATEGKSVHELATLDPKELIAMGETKMMLAASAAKKLNKTLDDVFARLNIPVNDLDE